jgi:hypothetical protein
MKTRKNTQDRKGSAFIVVMGIIGVLMIAGISMTLMTGHAAFTSRKLYAGEQALAIAESGVADTISKMTTNYVYWMQGSNSAAYAGGNFYVSTTFNTNTAHVVIDSVGVFAGERREVAMELLGTLWDLYDRSIGIAGAIICGGDAVLETSAMTVNGGVHANGDIINNTGNPEINGDLSAVGTSDITAESGYTTTTNALPMVIPNYLPLDAWKDLAQSNGIYYAGNTTLPGTTLRPTNGVVYCEGTVTVGNRSTLYGTLVASGSITINNRFDQYQFNSNWPCLLAGIDVNLHNRNTYTGVIFAGNNVSMRNNRTINGSVIALNDVLVENGAFIDPPPSPPAWSPDDTNETPPSVLIGGWLK